MKKSFTILATILLVMAGCGESKQPAGELITVDVTAGYPKKELILQDFMDVEYIPLETTDEFITMGWLHSIGKELILVRNRNRATDGKIFVFDRNGKGLRVINRSGQGGEEYSFLLGMTLDEDRDEIFVSDRDTRKILVYDLSGKFKRSLDNTKDIPYEMGIYNFDRDNLICQDGTLLSDGHPDRFMIISKQDGSITREIEIPYKEFISSAVLFDGENFRSVMPIRNRMLVPGPDSSWMLMENSSDTVYRLMSDYSMAPLIARTPAIQSMSPGIFLYPSVLTGRYCFMQTVKAEWDWENNTGHTRVDLVYDMEEKALFESVVYNADFTGKQPVSMTSEVTFGNNEIALVHKLEAYELVEAYEKGELKGRLAEIAATLDEESNPVIMLIKYKKK
ncbi:MAG: 6-bladed beta-propeller [Tannerellaceae bacterium]|jgi:hypothetical protein|nr:6-bladed beta-propeller [Tannerellaceae bacterium]